MSVFFYVGHIISDLFTARGIPIPGFFLTQLFTDGEAEESIAKIAESMYKDGYDMRHLASMNVPVLVKDIILSAYLRLSEESVAESPEPVADKEKRILDNALKKEKMTFIANSIAVGGNTLKFFTPPYSCNPNSLNAAEWFAFLSSTIGMIDAANRDLSAEEILDNRKEIDRTWNDLLKE